MQTELLPLTKSSPKLPQTSKPDKWSRLSPGVELAALVANDRGNTPQIIALRQWATEVYRSMKILTAKGSGGDRASKILAPIQSGRP